MDFSFHLDELNSETTPSADKLALIDELNSDNLSWWVNKNWTVGLIDWDEKRRILDTDTPSDEE